MSKNVAGKMRGKGNPYATWVDPGNGWTYHLLKSWQSDNSKSYGRWMMFVQGWGEDMGDVYVSDVLPGLNRAIQANSYQVDSSIWKTQGEFIVWAWGEK